ncbi:MULTISPECIES: purine nucleoside permease [unclassified Microbulbifer]|uniref:purine nucleoside permease n=1 Tax=unclassified Microbulbifer TaxID=2619833 RepID=UPI001E2CAB50|nr:purine nucleoside permease [Microbulbifer sp. YPW16]UHQ54128.1 purine nucleoside permease [Microbulbifer sp. YPW16]
MLKNFSPARLAHAAIRSPLVLIPLLLGLLFLAACEQRDAGAVAGAQEPIPVKVVVINMFEIGEDQGDTAGEFQLWKERQQLTQRFPFPQSHHDLYLNPETGVLGMVTGMGTNKSASAVMALGLDPRFDLSKAYWLVAGISGFDPADGSIGSAAWAEWLVDGDLMHEIDSREIPEDWSTGIFPLFSKGPYPEKRPPNQGEVFQINGDLTEWAYQLTRDTELSDDPTIAENREHLEGYPNAQRKPFVMKGDNLAGMTFWHGEHLNQWANKWVDYWTEGQGSFVSSAMEDTGTAQSLFYLDRAGKADYDRLMVLRTASNFTVPHPGMTAAESLLSEGEDYAGLAIALESAYRVGSRVVNTLVDNWDVYAEQMPYESATDSDRNDSKMKAEKAE